MEDETFRTRLVELLKKSRKAIRLYGTVVRNPRDPSSAFNETQAQECRAVNSELLRLLSAALDSPSIRKLTGDIFVIRDRFQQEWSSTEAEMVAKQQALSFTVQHGDFVKAALLSNELVVLKARFQATQAVHHELNDVIKKSRVVLPTIELSQVVPESSAPKVAKVIPLRRNEA